MTELNKQYVALTKKGVFLKFLFNFYSHYSDKKPKDSDDHLPIFPEGLFAGRDPAEWSLKQLRGITTHAQDQPDQAVFAYDRSLHGGRWASYVDCTLIMR